MKYAITYTTDGDWETTNTGIIEASNYSVAKDNLENFLRNRLLKQETIDYIINTAGTFYITDCSDVEYKV